MIYKITNKGQSASPRGAHNIETWTKVKAFLDANGGQITEGQFLSIAAGHDHKDGAPGYLYHLVNRNGWLAEY